jgi:hypothetical protein
VARGDHWKARLAGREGRALQPGIGLRGT